MSLDAVRLSVAEEPGTIFGDLSALLRRPHTADVRPLRRSTMYVADATTFFETYPTVALHVATGLARRLEAADLRMLEVRRKLETDEKAPGFLSRMVDSRRELAVTAVGAVEL